MSFSTLQWIMIEDKGVLANTVYLWHSLSVAINI